MHVTLLCDHHMDMLQISATCLLNEESIADMMLILWWCIQNISSAKIVEPLGETDCVVWYFDAMLSYVVMKCFMSITSLSLSAWNEGLYTRPIHLVCFLIPVP